MTEVEEHKPVQDRGRNRNFHHVLDHIAEIRERNRKSELPEPNPKGPAPCTEEKTLFYGVESIDGVEFKIKLKLSKTHYYLFAKNHHTKVMM